MGLMCKEIFFFNYSTSAGLNFSSGGTSYAGFCFNAGVAILFFEAILFTIFGLYLDQVVPS